MGCSPTDMTGVGSAGGSDGNDNNGGGGTAGAAGGGGMGTIGGGGMSSSDGGASTAKTLFPPTAAWNLDISNAPKDAESDQVIMALQSKGGWGTGTLQIDFSITVQHADASTPMMSFNPTGDFYTPDCDQAKMPVPPGGAIEGESGYSCTQDGDCHLIVIHEPTQKLYEMWRADITGGTFNGGCLAVWDLTRDYVPSGRGEGCTSADAGGFPIAAMLFTADEVAAGSIDHAIRYILPNDRIRKNVYVHPATHSTFASASTTPALAPPYGARLRLRADYPVDTLPSQGAKVVARALQKYGMILSDGGNIALTAADDRFTKAKWSGLLDAQDLSALKVGDFAMVDGGARIPYTKSSDCVRVP
jgi:serine/threonine-protein kinase